MNGFGACTKTANRTRACRVYAHDRSCTHLYGLVRTCAHRIWGMRMFPPRTDTHERVPFAHGSFPVVIACEMIHAVPAEWRSYRLAATCRASGPSCPRSAPGPTPALPLPCPAPAPALTLTLPCPCHCSAPGLPLPCLRVAGPLTPPGKFPHTPARSNWVGGGEIIRGV
jgi:hypothetical protein